MIPVGSHEEQGTKKKTVIRENYWNALTIVALLTTLAVVVILLVIFNNPAAGVNPYPPPAKVGEIVPLSANETSTSLPTWTPTSEPTLPAIDPPTAIPSPTTAVLIVAGTPAAAQSNTIRPSPRLRRRNFEISGSGISCPRQSASARTVQAYARLPPC